MTALQRMLRSMRDMRQGWCALCGHNEIIEAWPYEHGHGNATYNLAAAQTANWYGKTTTFGDFGAYICRRCGYTMWFAHQPDKIPVGQETGTKVLIGQGPPPGAAR